MRFAFAKRDKIEGFVGLCLVMWLAGCLSLGELRRPKGLRFY